MNENNNSNNNRDSRSSGVADKRGGHYNRRKNRHNRHNFKNTDSNQKQQNHEMEKETPSTTKKADFAVDFFKNDEVEAYTPSPAATETEYSITVDLDEDATLITEEPLSMVQDDSSPKTEVVGIRFKKAGKVYYFAPEGLQLKPGESAIVETARGLEFGEVACGNKMVNDKDIIQPLRRVVRAATKEDVVRNAENEKKEQEAFTICQGKIAAHGLDMKLIDVEYAFDNSKLLFYFTSAGRVDFRELVRDLASSFRTRIELRQIGIRDEAKLMGGLGVCGRSLCCNSFLSDFVQVSIKMAKEQNLSLNSTKISGSCGRLMCCLRYEHEVYEEELRLSPPLDSLVQTEDGVGTVIEVNPIAGLVKVKNTDKNDVPPKYYHRDNVKVLRTPKAPRNEPPSEEPDSGNK